MYANRLYEESRSPAKLKEAKRYYKLAADKGHVDSMYSLGAFYYLGLGLRRPNPLLACKYFGAAASQNHAVAQYCYGLCLLSGEGIKKNEAKAIRLIRQSADNGFDEAEYCFARILMDGHYISKDLGLAFNYMKKSHDHGNLKATFFMALFYYQGKVVKRDKKMGYKLMKQAYDGDLSEAEAFLSFLNRGKTLSSSLSRIHSLTDDMEPNETLDDIEQKLKLSNLQEPESNDKSSEQSIPTPEKSNSPNFN